MLLPFIQYNSVSSVLFEILFPLTLPQVPGHQSVFMNEPRLSDFKQVLLREGIQAEFVGGVLVCNNQVAVRRFLDGNWTHWIRRLPLSRLL